MLNRVRIPFYVNKPQYPADEDIYLKANGRRVTMKSIVTKTLEGQTDYIPGLIHERLAIALRHDEVNIENEKYSGSIRLAGAYDIEWQEFLDYPFAPAKFRVLEEAFDARSNRCEICEDKNFLNLQDDYVEEFIDEGDTVDINVAANDGVCCSSPVFSILSYDDSVIDSISITQSGVVTITLKTPLLSLTNVLLLTYKVICGELEKTATVTGNIAGSLSDPCPAPSNLSVGIVDPSATPYELAATWDASVPAPALDYSWTLHEWDGVTEIEVTSGTTPSLGVNINSLDCDKTYRFRVRAICGEDDVSATLMEEIEIPCAPVGKNMFLVNETGGTVTVDSHGTPYVFPTLTNGNVVIYPSTNFTNNSGATRKFRFLSSMPATLVIEQTLANGASYTFPADVSLYNYVRVSIP
jgi:hypothetical protein